jgi:hypothetical protein
MKSVASSVYIKDKEICDTKEDLELRKWMSG